MKGSAPDRAVATLVARSILGLTFFMAGWWKVFDLTPAGHARQLFVEPYAATFLPAWLLWASGAAIPVVELVAGALLLVGLWRRPAYYALGAVLVTVTFGHLLLEPLWSPSAHVIPRGMLLVFLLAVPEEWDRIAVDRWRRSRAGQGGGGSAGEGG